MKNIHDVKHDFETADSLDNWLDSINHMNSCYDVVVKHTKDKPFIADLVDALIDYAIKQGKAECELRSKGFTKADIEYCAYHIAQK